MKKYHFKLTILQTHLDVFGHVNNATYLQLFEQARWDLLNQNNYGWERIKTLGLGPVVLKISIQFIKELKLSDVIVIETEITDYKNKIFMMKQIMKRDETLCCEAEYTMGLFDLQKRKLVLPTPEWLQALRLT